MRWIAIAAFVGATALGCKKSGDEAAAPVAPGPRTEEAPPLETNTYVSAREDDEGDADEDDEGDAAKKEPAAKDDAPAGIPAAITTIADARALAEQTAQNALGVAESLASPALIRRWPAADRSIVFVVYPLTPAKTGVNSFTVGAPVEVTVNLIDGTAAHAALKKSAVVKEVERVRDPASLRDALESAEQALIDVLLERRTLGRSMVLLDGYREWFNAHRAMMTDLDKRMPEGIRWLKEPKEAAAAKE
ncbi:MAG: hypothetical protein R3B09_04985 [Nannocystaceae bacterium]